MHKFCDSILEEFKYLNKRLEDRILHKLGFYDKLWKPEIAPKFDIDDLLSQTAFEKNQYYQAQKAQSLARPASAIHRSKKARILETDSVEE